MIGNRVRAWLYRAGLRVVPVDDLANIGARLREVVDAVNGLGAYVRGWREAVQRAPSFVTVLVIGVDAESRAEPDGRSPIIFSTAARVTARGGQPISVEILRPLVHCSVVVLADLERVDLRAILQGTHALSMGSPITFSQSLSPGEHVRVICELRE